MSDLNQLIILVLLGLRNASIFASHACSWHLANLLPKEQQLFAPFLMLTPDFGISHERLQHREHSSAHSQATN